MAVLVQTGAPMPRIFALLAALLSTTSFAQELTPPPPPPPVSIDAAPPAPRPEQPRPLRADDPTRFRLTRGRIPEGFHLVEEPKWGFVAGGLGAVVGSTAIMVLVAGVTRDAFYAIPIAGQIRSFIELLGLDRQASGTSKIGTGFALVFGGIGLAADLVVQVAGVVLTVMGFARPSRWLERDASAPQVMFVPGAAGAPLGASLVGRL